MIHITIMGYLFDLTLQEADNKQKLYQMFDQKQSRFNYIQFPKIMTAIYHVLNLY